MVLVEFLILKLDHMTAISMLSRWDMVLYIELFQNSDKVMYKTLRISNYKNIKKERTSKAESLM